MKRILISVLLLSIGLNGFSQGRIRNFGIIPGIFQPGEYNAITDVPGVRVGHVTINKGEDIHTGVTAVLPHEGNIFKRKCPAAVFVGNGYGKMVGISQIQESGNIETPVILTNTLSVAQGMEGLITYTLNQKGNEKVRSVNPVVAEANDGKLNNIRARIVTQKHVLDAISRAKSGPVEEGSVGAGTGAVSFGFKGGIGTSSRVLPATYGGYTVGVLVQSNYGGILEINGVQVGVELGAYSYKDEAETKDQNLSEGSCTVVLITNAPVGSRNLERLAKRVFMGLAKTGSFVANGTGCYVLAISNYPDNLINEDTPMYYPTLLHNEAMSPLFEAAVEATEEAVWNSLFAGKDTNGYRGYKVKALPVPEVVELMKQPVLK
ncbi:MAG: P1 family peptidase [Bacteroidales bacterium]|nr:P1 family peptidase [Bacteroidales bacterium]